MFLTFFYLVNIAGLHTHFHFDGIRPKICARNIHQALQIACSVLSTTPVLNLHVETSPISPLQPPAYVSPWVLLPSFTKHTPLHIYHYRTSFFPITHKNVSLFVEQSRQYLQFYEIDEQSLNDMTAHHISRHVTQKFYVQFQPFRHF